MSTKQYRIIEQVSRPRNDVGKLKRFRLQNGVKCLKIKLGQILWEASLSIETKPYPVILFAEQRGSHRLQ